MEKQRYNLLKERYERMTAGREKIDVLIEMTLEVRSTDAEKALEMPEQNIQESEKTGDLAGKGEGLNQKGDS
jgi:hypothetical protein